MNANTPKLITLSCPSCGAKLDISPNLDRFACAFCGQEHIVNRGGGTISLSPVVEAIHQVKTGVDKTAAELAIVRIQKEISDLQMERQNIFMKSPQPTINRSAFFLLFAAVFIILYIISSFQGNVFLAVGVILLFTGVISILSMSKERRDWRKSTESRINDIDTQIAKKRAVLERNQNLVRN